MSPRCRVASWSKNSSTAKRRATNVHFTSPIVNIICYIIITVNNSNLVVPMLRTCTKNSKFSYKAHHTNFRQLFKFGQLSKTRTILLFILPEHFTVSTTLYFFNLYSSVSFLCDQTQNNQFFVVSSRVLGIIPTLRLAVAFCIWTKHGKFIVVTGFWSNESNFWSSQN